MAKQDTNLIVVDIGGGGGGKEPPPAGGDGGGDGDRGRQRRKPPQRRYSTAITLGMISILMFFLGLCVAFLVLKHVSQTWAPLHLPKIQRRPGLAYVLQDQERHAQAQEEHQDGNHAQRDGRRIAALRRFAAPPASITISATVAARGRLFSSASATNIDDNQLSILRSHDPSPELLPSLVALTVPGVP